MLKNWLKKLPTAPGLPDPNKEATAQAQDICHAANKAILQAHGDLPVAEASPSRKRKRGQYGHYTP